MKGEKKEIVRVRKPLQLFETRSSLDQETPLLVGTSRKFPYIRRHGRGSSSSYTLIKRNAWELLQRKIAEWPRDRVHPMCVPEIPPKQPLSALWRESPGLVPFEPDLRSTCRSSILIPAQGYDLPKKRAKVSAWNLLASILLVRLCHFMIRGRTSTFLGAESQKH